MLMTPALFASIVVLAIGALILWSNPTRMVNRAVLGCSLAISLWLACLHLAIAAPVPEKRFWIRLTNSTGALIPLSFWLVKESIVGGLHFNRLAWVGRNAVWLLGPLLLAILPATDLFMMVNEEGMRIRGGGYRWYFVGLIGLYLALFQITLKNLRTLTGGRRLELQVWLLGGCSAAIAVYLLIGLSELTGDSLYRRLQPLAALAFYAGTAFAITTNRIFDARQILLVLAEKVVLVASVAAVAYYLEHFISMAITEPFAFLATTVLALWFAAALNRKLDKVFRFYPQDFAVREAVFSAARRESRVPDLERAFLSVLKGWGQTDSGLILTGGKEGLRGGGLELANDSRVMAGMRQLKWATPERLARERPTPEKIAVAEFLSAHKLGALLIGEGPTLSVLAGVGVPASRRPFTYPQVAQLTDVVSIMESAFERAHFSVKAQHAEQLATVGLLGASLAHEIRNPLVSIKTFVQLLPKHHQDPAFREKFFKLIGDEVGRIDQLTEQLLDLASPRTYVADRVELHPVLRASLDLVAAKAMDKDIQFFTELNAAPDEVFTDASAAKQVMLNLCFNAIQAVESSRGGERWVRIATRNTAGGVEMLVADSGPGISPDILPKLFQPFQTTKSSGFGLGLAICRDILVNLNASITVDPTEPGRGATFRVIFPCQPSSS